MKAALLLIPALLLMSTITWAETDTIEVMHLPLAEAAAAAQSQLSAGGRIAQLPSRRLLIITDDAAHIEKARELLSQLDAAPAQLSVQVKISEQAQSDASGVSVSQLVLPGGWIRLNATHNARHSRKQRQFMLRTSSGAAGHIEAGEIRTVQQSVRHYLTSHGIVSESNVELLDVTAGFDVQATLLAADEVRLSIRPWLRDDGANASMDGRMELLLDTGNTQAPALPPASNAPLRLNMQPQAAGDGDRIMVTEAATELTVKLDEQVTLAASNSSANEFSTVLLGRRSLSSRRELTISLRVSRVGL